MPDLVEPGEKRQPNHVGDRQAGGDNQHRCQEQAQTTDKHDDSQDTVDPLAVVTDIGHSSDLAYLRRKLADAVRIGPGSEPDFDRRRQRVPLESPSRDAPEPGSRA